ncbi:MAG: TRAP transporter large permease subunit [Nitrospirae bacterium]|nr:MAG: TRAP transporter large permease subunit [Nitrospirota bacterium]
MALAAAGLVAAAFLGLPLFAVIGGAALLCFHAAEIDPAAVIVETYRLTSSSGLITIPLFVLAGVVLAASQAPRRLLRAFNAVLGWVPGGLAVVALVSCAFFTAFTGASGVTILALGCLLYPMLRQEGYGERFSLGLLTSSGSLGLLLPPSLPIILYGIVAQVSIDRLFLAGVVPALFHLLINSLYAMAKGIAFKVPRTPFSRRELVAAVRGAAWDLPLPALIVAGIYSGLTTASEAAAVVAAYVLFVELVIYRDLSLFRDIPGLMREGMVLVGTILIILGCALGLTSYLVDAQVPMRLLELIRGFIHSRVVFLLWLNLFLLVVGAMMDIFSAIMVVVPLILPIAESFGVHPVHLGIIFLANLEAGYSTPPVGINLFIACSRFEKPILTLYRATLPFLALMVVWLLGITYLPGLSLWLPRLAAGAGLR